ncbi:hypothetical protein CHS0354_020284 [Potamilus streckersoni]|uniref:Uncharacterized protein n=1 Tax=Potamilus streckersoni TaxID=2493646 RepID=A0AAE0S5K3_9BIVA|nr:hypothetical protein CHS0354_020284 [Potamilus streckersoni]
MDCIVNIIVIIIRPRRHPQEFFFYLQERNILSVDNLVHLQAMLWHLSINDLIKECAKYAETVLDTLYFHQPSPERRENGYQEAVFHVEGKDLTKYKREDLEKLRTILSRRLGVPHEFVIISGLTPSKSLVITVMIPEYNAEILVELLEENRLTELTDLGIDSVLINDQTFIISEKSKLFISEERNEISELLEKLERSQSLQEQSTIDLLRLRKKLQERHGDSKITEHKLAKLTHDISELLKMQLEMFKMGVCQEKPSRHRVLLLTSGLQ